MCKIGTFQGNLSTIFLKLLNIYLFSKIFQKVKTVMLWWNILQYFKNMLRQYFNCNEVLGIFLTCFYNILCYVHGENFMAIFTTLSMVIWFSTDTGDFFHTCLYFYYACGNIRHTEYRNNYHTIDFHTVL